MSVAFSSVDRLELSSNTHVQPNEARCLKRVLEDYDLDRCVDWVNHMGVKAVCLQFADEQLIDSVTISNYLEEHTRSTTYYILGDTSYGSCCVDFVAAEHAPADAVIHFGPACLTQMSFKATKSNIPVLFSFQKPTNVDMESLLRNLLLICNDLENIILFTSCEFSHKQDEVFDYIKANNNGNIIINSRLLTEESKTHACSSSLGPCSIHCRKEWIGFHEINHLGRGFCFPDNSSMKNYNLIYIGEESLFLHGLMASYVGTCQSFTCIHPTGITFNPSLDAHRMRRVQSYLVQVVREASTMALVLASPGDPCLLPAVHHIRKLVSVKKPPPRIYSLAIGKPNPAKLANFLEVDVFVLLACPQHPLLTPGSRQELSKEYYKPIVGLSEVEMAFNMDHITTSVDFHSLVPGGWEHKNPEMCQNSDSLDVSLINKCVVKFATDENCSEERAMLEKKVGELIETGTVGLVNRSWKGLEPGLGQHAPAEVEAGRQGIASKYVNEPK